MIDSLIAQINDACSDLPEGERPLTCRRIVEREAGCDTDRLYGPLPQAIAYLKEIHARHPEATLDEKWTGYEDMYMRFSWSELQTDAEYVVHLERTLSLQRYQRNERDKKRAKEREKLEKQLRETQRKLKELGA